MPLSSGSTGKPRLISTNDVPGDEGNDIDKVADMAVGRKSWILFVIIGLGCVGGIYFAWQYYRQSAAPAGIVSGNGRIEAVEIDIATKTAGRLNKIFVDEGDFVIAGQLLAEMDTATLQAQFKEAKAVLRQAEIAVDIARSRIDQRKSEKAAARAAIAQHQAELDLAGKHLERSEDLAVNKIIARQTLDDDRAAVLSRQAILLAAEANLSAIEAAISTARAQLIGAGSDVEAAQAVVERISTELEDGLLKATRDGRVQYRIVQPGEVLPAGGKVLNLIDLSDVYMTFFLATEAAGKLGIGAEARLILDAAPHYVIPAKISFVADVAQFTPKSVETASERQKLMFRVKAQIPSELLKKHIRYVKTGLPGMAYVRLDPQTDWPETLRVNLPE